VWTKQIQGYGDPSGDDAVVASATSIVQEYAKQGFQIIAPARYLTRRVETNINAVTRLLLGVPKPLVICGVKADELALHFRNNTWPVDPITQKRRKGSTKPEDNVHNHALRALAYMAVTKFPPPVELGGDEPVALSRDARRAQSKGVCAVDRVRQAHDRARSRHAARRSRGGGERGGARRTRWG